MRSPLRADLRNGADKPATDLADGASQRLDQSRRRRRRILDVVERHDSKRTTRRLRHSLGQRAGQEG